MNADQQFALLQTMINEANDSIEDPVERVTKLAPAIKMLVDSSVKIHKLQVEQRQVLTLSELAEFMDDLIGLIHEAIQKFAPEITQGDIVDYLAPRISEQLKITFNQE